MTDNSVIPFLMSVIKMLLANIPFILLCFGLKRTNLNKVFRSRQYVMPLVAVVYSIVVLIFVARFNNFLVGKIQGSVETLRTWTGINGLPSEANSILSSLALKLADIITGLNLTFWIFFITNTLILLGYIAVKGIILGIIKKTYKKDDELHKSISGNFYVFHEDKDVWCVRDNLLQARDLLKTFYYASIVISIIMMMVSKKWFLDETLKSLFYPVFSIILVGEVYFFLDGIGWEEYLNDILGENEEAYKTVNYSLLRKFLRTLFGDKLLADNTQVNNGFSRSLTNDEVIDKLESYDDPTITTFASFVQHINADGFEIDQNYIFSTVDLLKGKSVLFNNPFYNDLIPYAFYPMNRELLKHNKALILLGRHAIENDIIDWIEKGIGSVTNIPYIWNIDVLGNEQKETDIGIVTRSDMLNKEVLDANSDFLNKVTYVVIIEPSKLIPTSQIGLELIVKKCREINGNEITFCMCDKNCDGLIDSLSHILSVSLTEVAATNKHKGTSSYMCWDSDDEHLHHRLFPNVSRYLGTGTELSFAALKNQVSKTQWFGGETFPVTDINWIDRQYYYELNKYADLPNSQEAFSERFKTSPNFWSACISENNYFTVEDESFNMFEILRNFSTRSKEQGFINVISSDYLLKDYMSINSPIFETDPKAIPYLSADYARTERNTVLRLLLQMSSGPIKTEIIKNEFNLLGISIYDLKKQFWYEVYKCFVGVNKLKELPKDYTDAVCTAFDEVLKIGNDEITSKIIKIYDEYNVKTGYIENYCSITDKVFLNKYTSSLKSAGYVVEDEKGENSYIGAELTGHIYQKLLPGQFFTFGGKYYEMQYLTADGRVLVRRAADHIDGRKNYRQIREYCINDTMPSNKICSAINVSGLKITKEFADFDVSTSGYYVLEKYSDFKTAKKITFEGEHSIPERNYKNKQVLKLDFPDTDGKFTDGVRFTITVLLNEVFRTLFAENQQFIVAVTDLSFTEKNDPQTYSLSGEGISSNSIYIIEDSDLDLGLLISVERNIQRILKIIDDYLDWHFEALEIVANPPEDPVPFIPPKMEEPKKKSFIQKLLTPFKKIGKWFRKLFGKAPKEECDQPEYKAPAEDGNIEAQDSDANAGLVITNNMPVSDGEETSFVSNPDGSITDVDSDTTSEGVEVPEEVELSDEIDLNSEQENDIAGSNFEDDISQMLQSKVYLKNDSDNVEPQNDEEPIDNTEIDQNQGDESEKTESKAQRIRKPYSENHFMLFGNDAVLEAMKIKETLELLNIMGFDRNELRSAREARKEGIVQEEEYVPNKPGSKYCDFCGTEIFGVEFETLSDGRDRCITCSNTAVKTADEFKKIFNDVKRNMEAFYGVKINTGIRVEMVNSKKLHKKLGDSFVPTDNYDPRTIGVAIRDKSGYTLLIENGAPKIQSMMTIAHELTHIWQYLNWDDKELKKKYGKDGLLEVYEGMAKWVEIQYAYLINEPITAKREEILTICRQDEYGRGFVKYLEKYPFSIGTTITKPTPFINPKDPLS